MGGGPLSSHKFAGVMSRGTDQDTPPISHGTVRRRPTPVAVLLCLLSFAAFYAAQRAAQVTMLDLDVYRAEGWAIRTGADLYDMRATVHGLSATYPPFAALLFVPLTWLDLDATRIAVNLVNLTLVVALVHLSLRLIGRRPPRIPLPALTFAGAALAVWCEPVWTTLRYGQVNLLLAVLVLWDLSRRADHRWAGIGIGVAAGIKLTPALFAVLLAVADSCSAPRGCARASRVERVPEAGAGRGRHVRRDGRTGRAAGAARLAALLDRDHLRREPGGRGRVDGQPVAARGRGPRPAHRRPRWLLALAAVVVVGCAGLAIAVAALLAGDRLSHAPAWAAVSCGVTALLVSPVSWSHHWVWAVPLVLLLVAEAMRRRERRWTVGAVAAGVLFQSFALWLVPHDAGSPELDQNLTQMALSASYPLAGVAFLAAAAVVTARAWLLRPPVLAPVTGLVHQVRSVAGSSPIAGRPEISPSGGAVGLRPGAAQPLDGDFLSGRAGR